MNHVGNNTVYLIMKASLTIWNIVMIPGFAVLTGFNFSILAQSWEWHWLLVGLFAWSGIAAWVVPYILVYRYIMKRRIENYFNLRCKGYKPIPVEEAVASYAQMIESKRREANKE